MAFILFPSSSINNTNLEGIYKIFLSELKIVESLFTFFYTALDMYETVRHVIIFLIAEIKWNQFNE